METITKEKMEEALTKFCESFREIEKQKSESVPALYAGAGKQDALDAFRALEEKQPTLFALLTSIFESYCAEMKMALNITNATVHAASAGLKFKEPAEVDVLPSK